MKREQYTFKVSHFHDVTMDLSFHSPLKLTVNNFYKSSQPEVCWILDLYWKWKDWWYEEVRSNFEASISYRQMSCCLPPFIPVASHSRNWVGSITSSQTLFYFSFWFRPLKPFSPWGVTNTKCSPSSVRKNKWVLPLFHPCLSVVNQI